MRLGLVARSETRGLGIQSLELARALNPDVLLIDDCEAGNPHWYPGATRVPYRLQNFERIARAWLRGVDAVYAAETFYSPQFTMWARDEGVATFVHVNPEFHRDDHNPTTWWAPTDWRIRLLPPDTTVVPVPVASDRFTPVEPHDGPCRWLHVAGRTTLGDRNGTVALLAAIPHLTQPCSITIAAQDRRFDIPTTPDGVTVNVVGPARDYWTLYDGHDALVLPRRYGGLCLPAQEAMAAGLAVAMPDCSPNPQTWPVHTFPVMAGRIEKMPAGRIEVLTFDAKLLASAMDALADPTTRSTYQSLSREWAAAHSWDVWADRYRSLMSVPVAV